MMNVMVYLKPAKAINYIITIKHKMPWAIATIGKRVLPIQMKY